MKRILPLLFCGIIALIMIFSACEKVVYIYPEIPVPDSISYSLEIQPIWDAKCVSCHAGKRDPDLSPGVSHGALIDGGYINTDDPAESALMKKLYGSHNARVTQAEKTLIQEWINKGAKDN